MKTCFIDSVQLSMFQKSRRPKIEKNSFTAPPSPEDEYTTWNVFIL